MPKFRSAVGDAVTSKASTCMTKQIIELFRQCETGYVYRADVGGICLTMALSRRVCRVVGTGNKKELTNNTNVTLPLASASNLEILERPTSHPLRTQWVISQLARILFCRATFLTMMSILRNAYRNILIGRLGHLSRFRDSG